MEFMKAYIDQGRFGEFVNEILEMEAKRKEEKEEKEEDDRLWIAYVHSMADVSFGEWKRNLFERNETESEPATLSMTNEQVEETMQNARGILKRFSPS